MSLPSLAFSREPLCIGAAAGRRPDRSRRSGRDASDPPVSPPGAAQRPPPRLPRRLPPGRGSLASELIPAGRLGGPERTAATASGCVARLTGTASLRFKLAALVCLPAVVVIHRR